MRILREAFHGHQFDTTFWAVTTTAHRRARADSAYVIGTSQWPPRPAGCSGLVIGFAGVTSSWRPGRRAGGQDPGLTDGADHRRRPVPALARSGILRPPDMASGRHGGRDRPRHPDQGHRRQRPQPQGPAGFPGSATAVRHPARELATGHATRRPRPGLHAHLRSLLSRHGFCCPQDPARDGRPSPASSRASRGPR